MTESLSPSVRSSPSTDGPRASPSAELLRDLQQIAATPGTEPETLRDLVCGYVGTLKAEGLPPERVIVAVKAAARDAGLRYGDMLESRLALDRIVRWSITEYYRAD
jgi:hypothetical protein